LSFCPGLKVTTRRAEIGISSPVFRVAPGALVLVTQIEVAEAGQLHLLVVLEADANLLEEQLDDLLGLALVQPEFLEEPFAISDLVSAAMPSSRFPVPPDRVTAGFRNPATLR
jgi:hypothetical protein